MRLTRLVHIFTPIGMATIVAGTLAVFPATTAVASAQELTIASSRGSANLSALAGPLGTSAANLATELSPAGSTDNGSGQVGHTVAPPPTVPPSPDANSVSSTSSTKGFDGLDHTDQRLAGTGAYVNTQFSLEPPDQGLCVGNGFVVEPINTAVQVYDSRGHAQLAGPVALNQFFGLKPEVIRSSPPVYGDFSSDPKCLYDAATNRFFLTLLQIDVNPSTGHFGFHSALLIAVSNTGDPRGMWHFYRIDSTDATHKTCPCLGDQPLIGTDQNGFYITTNEFAIHGAGFNGAQVYAMSKRALARGAVNPTVVHMDVGETTATPDVGGIWYSLQPAVSAQAVSSRDVRSSDEESSGRGTEYFMGALDFFSTLDNRVVVFSLSNTRSLNFHTPLLTLTHAVISTETYGQPNPNPNDAASVGATQKDGGPGSRPLGELLGEPLTTLNGNDDRMNQVVLADGRLWSGVNTIIGSGANKRDGIAWFSVDATARDGSSLEENQQGYVSLAKDNVLFPSIAVGNSGPIMTFTVVGPNFFPSAAYKRLGDDSRIQIVGKGTLPADGFSAYPEFGVPQPGIERWGDYTAAVTASDGSVWMAAEYINTSAARPRTQLANWGTFIMHVSSGDNSND